MVRRLGCACWDQRHAQLTPSGGSPTTRSRARFSANTSSSTSPARRWVVFYQDDDFGTGGLTGIKYELPASQIVSAQPYQPGAHTTSRADLRDQGGGCRRLVCFTVPIYTALGSADVVHARLQTAAGRIECRIDPTTVGRSAEDVLQRKAGTELIGRRDHRRLPAVCQRNCYKHGFLCAGWKFGALQLPLGRVFLIFKPLR